MELPNIKSVLRNIKCKNAIKDFRVRNSKLAINRLVPDILYNIFVSAIYDSPDPVATALIVSYVCHSWRKSALEWPVLWGFVNLDITSSIIDLFMSRSGNAPLTLLWTDRTWSWRTGAEFETYPPKLYLESKANLIVPRLCSLTLHLTHSEFAQIQHVFQSQKLPLQLRHLDIDLHTPVFTTRVSLPPLTDLLRLDLTCLRELTLRYDVDLPSPWLQLPHRKLTHFKISYLKNPPTLSQLLGFLSYCPLLQDLEFCISDINPVRIDINAVITRSISRLDFPYLKRLVLKSKGMTSYGYILELSTRIRPTTSLSKFSLVYNNHPPRSIHHQWRWATHPINIFEAIPFGILSQCADNKYLCIAIELEKGIFEVCSGATERNTRRPDGYPLHVSGSFPAEECRSASFDHLSPLLYLICTMSDVTHLKIDVRTWRTISPWMIDIPSSFPWLDTLELRWLHRDSEKHYEDVDSVLDSLPASLKLKKLILEYIHDFSLEALLSAILRTGVEVFEMKHRRYDCEGRRTAQTVETALRQRGIAVIIISVHWRDVLAD